MKSVICSSEEEQDSDDWMTTLLQTKAFHRIPPANIQAIFMRLHSDELQALVRRLSNRVMTVITSTLSLAVTCAVTRETPLNKEGIKLAELAVGDSFGEEALISEAKRNATVTMDDGRHRDAPRQR